ncbi:MAG: ATP-binding protein [Nitrospirota bacterium]|nr:ATP-binding protein [Nitrospirota bacterium]
MNLRTKVLLPFVLIALVLLLFLYGYWTPRHIVDLKHEYQQATERHLVSVVEGLIPLLLAHQLDAVYENLDTLKQRNVNWLSIRLLNGDGTKIYPLVPQPPVANDREIHAMEQPVRYQDTDLGKLIVDVDFDEPLKDLHIRHHQLLGITSLVILLSIGIIWLVIERMVSRPVADLAQASKRLAEGDFAAQLPPVQHDEVGELVKNFDQMRLSIRGYQAELITRNESLNKLFHAVEQSPVSIVITDRNGIVEYVNPKFNDVMGYGPGEMLGKDILILKAGTEAAPDFEAIWQEILSGKTWRGEFQSVRKNGKLFWQFASLSPIQNDKGGITHAVALLEDISERRALEDQLRQAQKMEAVGLLTGGIAHDFNNILSAIIGYGSILRMKMAAGDPLRNNVDEILHASERAAALIRSLMAFSRKQVANPTNVNVNECINRMEKLLLRTLREDIEFRTMLHRASLTIFIDPVQMEQVLINLATNARDAMPQGGSLIIETARVRLDERFRIRHGEAAIGTYVMISVSDTGIGMDKKTQEHIFEPFFTTKEPGRGTGLGLSMVYGIVKQNNGYINCYSTPGKGTTFKIYLPMVAAPRETLPTEPVFEIQRGTERILLAEDDEPLRKYTKTILEEAGYTVVEASNGIEAVERFKERPDAVDLLLLDVIMPKKNGKEAYEEIRRTRPGIKVLFTSGYTAELIGQQGMLNNHVNFLSKPCTPNELLGKVRAVLESSVQAFFQ